MQPCPGRVFPNDTLNSCMRPLRLSFLLALAWMPSVLSAQARLPTGAQALDPASGRVVYEERRSALYTDARMIQSDLVCLSDQGQVSGRINLDLSGEYAEMEWTDANGDHLHLSRSGSRWRARYQSEQRRSEVRWPRLRAGDLIEDDLLAFLQSHVDDLKQQNLNKLVVVRAPDLRRQSFAVQVSMLDAQRLDIRLQDQGWFSDSQTDMRIIMRSDGRLLSYQGPPTCPLPEGAPSRVDVQYLY